MALHTITSTVRGGKYGADAWCARITGLDPVHGLKREWVYKQKNLSGSGRSGTIDFEIDRPGTYEYGKVQHDSSLASIGRLDNGFIHVAPDGSVAELKRSDVFDVFKQIAAA